jgi:hypothetical protein
LLYGGVMTHHARLPFFRIALLVVTAGCAPTSCTPSCGGTPPRPDGGRPPAIDATAPPRPDAAPVPDDLIFDHRHTDLADVPLACIETVKNSTAIFHYAHRSHGSQLIVGAESLEQADPTYAFVDRFCGVPWETGALRMWDGMTTTNLVDADGYWATTAGIDELRGILANPDIRTSAWAWSFEIADQTEASVQQYLDTMSALEAEFPAVTFVYMTGPTTGTYNAVNRAQRNEQIRAFARQGRRVLFDFEDLDAWWNGEHHTAVIDGVTVPMEHPRYSLETPGNVEYQWSHTTQESCETKARAFWTMLAVLEGCALPGTGAR